MKVLASRDLARHPTCVAFTVDGGILVETRSGQGTFLEAYDVELGIASQVHVDRPSLALTSAPGGRHWLVDTTGIACVDTRGNPYMRMEVRTPAGMCLSAFAVLDDGFVVSCQHKSYMPVAPVVKRLNKDGTEHWSVTQPIEPIAYDGVTELGREQGWKERRKDPWMPTCWCTTSRMVAVSGDAVLVCFEERRSGISFGYVLSLSVGALQFMTEKGPIGQVKALGEEAFLVGYQGYDAFETLLYERDGCVRTRWPSHGYYVVMSDDIRVIELENVLPSRMHLVRLQNARLRQIAGSLD